MKSFAFSGEMPGWLALLIDAAEKSGNGIQLRDMATGSMTPLDSAKANYKSLAWNERGDALAALKGFEDKTYEEPSYRMAGVTLTPWVKMEFDPAKTAEFPKGLSVSGSRRLGWTEDLSVLTFGIAEANGPKRDHCDGNHRSRSRGLARPFLGRL